MKAGRQLQKGACRVCDAERLCPSTHGARSATRRGVENNSTDCAEFMQQTFKIYGMFRSGTNLTKVLLEQNFQAKCEAYYGGHKHFFIPGTWDETGFVADTRTVVIVVKDPYAQLVSLFRYAQETGFRHFDCPRDWSAYLRSWFTVTLAAPQLSPTYRFRNPIAYWNELNLHWVASALPRKIIVRYEDILADPEKEMQRISAQFPDIRRLDHTASLPGNILLKVAGDTTPETFETEIGFEKTSYYLNRHYMREFGYLQRRFVRSQLDPELVGRLGYNIP